MKDLLYQLSYITVEHKVGFEPTNKGFAVPAIRPLWYLCIIVWLRWRESNPH